jgi:hypothetical protein
MYEKVTFVAVDGKEFENEDECQNHERLLRQKQLENKVRFYTDTFKPASLERDKTADIEYIEILDDSESTFQAVNDIFHEDGYCEPFDDHATGCGMWRYDHSKSWGSWVNMESELAILEYLFTQLNYKPRYWSIESKS